MKRTIFAVAATSLCALSLSAQAQVSGDVVKIGLITDLSGTYSDIDGNGGAEAVRMAIADMGGMVNGKKVEFVVADHQNKADIASSKAREWFDREGVDMLIGGTNSGTNLAMAKVAAEKKKVFISIGAGSARLTNEECTPYTIHYAYDTIALARGTGSTIVKQGGKSWYFLTADYAFGQSLEKDTSDVIKAGGGTVLGSAKHPLAASDFSSFLLQAQNSKAQILGLANAGGDTINAIKAANEFGITKSMKLAGLLMFINDVHSLGLKLTQGMYLTTGWYWAQYQPVVRYMPWVSFRPSECTSLMNISRPASFMLLVMPNSLAALMALMVSPPALARPRIWALEFCACSRKDEKSEAASGCLALPSTVPPPALMTSEVSFSSDWPKA